MIILYILAAMFVAFCILLAFALCNVSGHHSRLEEQEARRAHGCCNGNCNQGGLALYARRGRHRPRSHYRWPYGTGAHAIAVCLLAALAAVGYVLTH